MEHLPPPGGQVPAGDVQAAHEQIAAGGGLGQVDDLPHIPGLHLRPAQQEAGLGQAAAALVHGDGSHVRPGLHGGDGHGGAEVEVGAVGLVRQAEHARVMGHADNGPQIRAYAVVGRVVYQHGHRMGVLPDGPGQALPCHAQGYAQGLIHVGVDVHGHRAAEHQSVDDAAVHVAGEDDLIPPLAGGEHHALHGAGGAPHHQEGVGRAEGVRRQLLCLPDDGYRVAQVVQGLHAVHVQVDALFSQEGRQLRVAPAPLVAGHVEGHHPHEPEALQRLVDRGAVLIQHHLLHGIIPFALIGSGIQKSAGFTNLRLNPSTKKNLRPPEPTAAGNDDAS